MNVAANVIRRTTFPTFPSSARSRWTSSSVSSCLASLSGATRGGLSPRDLAHRLQRVDFAYGLVGPQPRDPGKPHRVPGLVPIVRLDLIERDFDDGVRNDGPHSPIVLNGVLEKIFGHLGDLLIGESGVGLADVEQPLAVADRERVVGQHAATLAMSPLDRGH